MEKKLLIEINGLDQAQDFIKNKKGTLLLSLMGVSTKKEFNCYTNELSFISDLAKEHDVEIFINLDMLYHEDDLIGLRAILKKISKMHVAGLVILDIAVIALCQELKINFKFINGSSILNTNYASLNSAKMFYDGYFLSNEINIEEITKIANEVDSYLVVQMFGKQKVFTSKRKLLSAFYEFNNKPITDFYPTERFLISDINDEDNFSYIYEDNVGTYIYTMNNVLGIDYLDTLNDTNVKYIYLSNLFCDEADYNLVVDMFLQYLENKITLDVARDTIIERFDNLSNSFFEDKTIFTREQIKTLEMESSNG